MERGAREEEEESAEIAPYLPNLAGVCPIEKQKERQKDKHTDRQTDRQTHRQTDKARDR